MSDPPPPAGPDRRASVDNGGKQPILGFGTNVHHHLHELVRALVSHGRPQDSTKKKTKAGRFWDLLRAHVHRGFFHSLLNQRTTASSDFISLVDTMWTLVHKYSPKRFASSSSLTGVQRAVSPSRLYTTYTKGVSSDATSAQDYDSTTEFVMAGWAKIRAAQHAVERQKGGRAIDFGAAGGGGGGGMGGGRGVGPGGMAVSPTPGEFSSMYDEGGGGGSMGGGGGYEEGAEGLPQEGKDATSTTLGGRAGLGLEGLSLDTVPNLNVTNMLGKIAKGLHEQPVDEADFYTVQVHFNRGWKLLLLGLNQAESFARYMAMVALRRAIPVINDTLLDSITRANLFRVLINLTVSDERSENRLKAVYLLGQLGFYLGTVREHDHLLMMAFKTLSQKLLEIQYAEKKKIVSSVFHILVLPSISSLPTKLSPTKISSPHTHALKLHLFHAIGKYTRFIHKRSRFIEDLVVYMIHEEFEMVKEKEKERGKKEKRGRKDKEAAAAAVEVVSGEAMHVVQVLLGVLNNEMKRTDMNQKYIGAIFKGYVHPLMRSTSQSLQMMAVQFISNWLPIMTEDATVLGIETLQAGLKETKRLNAPGFDMKQWKKEMAELERKKLQSTIKLSLRSALLRQLLSVPGTFSRLTPVPDHPGFFIEVNSSMMHTKGIVVNLPVHPKSSVRLTRLLPSIPGVPRGVTTIPPVFMDPMWAEKQKAPQYRYEYLERTGQVPGLPFGYTYAPLALVEVTPQPKSLEQEARDMRAAVLAAEREQAGKSRGWTPGNGLDRGVGGLAGDKVVRRGTLFAPGAYDQRGGPSTVPNARPRRMSGVAEKEKEKDRSRPSSTTRRSSVGPPLKQKKLKDRGDIPPGTARIPQKTDMIPGDRRGVPPGFLNSCPFPGYDPDKVDRSAGVVSAIYGKYAGRGGGPGGAGAQGVAGAVAAVTQAVGTVPGGKGMGAFGGMAGAQGMGSSQAGGMGVGKKSGGEQPKLMEADVPEGFTIDRHPVLWPSRLPNLRSHSTPTDFPPNAPVIFDIIQPGTSVLQRVLTRVTSVNKELSAVSVQREAGDSEVLSVGATFNIFIRTREKPLEWVSVNLEVLDDDYQDDVTLTKPKLQTASGEQSLQNLVGAAGRESRVSDISTVHHRMSVLSNVPSGTAGGTSTAVTIPSGTPHPAGFTAQGEPYFAPPINLPPFPVGYTVAMIPYFGRTASVKPQPLGLTTQGVRFYAADPKVPMDQSGRNQLTGYDNTGQPFYIARGCTLPPPAGFTPDGIAYYDIPSLLHQRGVMVVPTPVSARKDWPLFSDEEEEEGLEEIGDKSMTSSRASLVNIARASTAAKRKGQNIDQAALTAQLVESLGVSQPGLKQHFLQTTEHEVGIIYRVADFEKLRRAGRFDEMEDIVGGMGIEEPEDIVAFLRDSEDLAYLRPTTMRVQMDPPWLTFQSVHAPLTKPVMLRYRAGRGDHTERDFFLSVQPPDVFSIRTKDNAQTFHLKLQGEGTVDISVTYYPSAMKSDMVEGSVNLIDESGKKLAVCGIHAIRQSFVRASPAFIDAGWMLPEKRKECLLKIENVSGGTAVVTLGFQSEQGQNEGEKVGGEGGEGAEEGKEGEDQTEKAEDTVEVGKPKHPAFILPTRQIRLQAHESKAVPVYFEPGTLGRFADVIEINGPGGELIKVQISGIAGIPIALYPENEENSRAGAAELTRERSDFMRKFTRAAEGKEKEGGGGGKGHVALTGEDTAILKNMMSATSDQESRKEAHTMDFGICIPTSEPHERMRCLTLMNLSDTPVTVGLYPHSPALRCPYLVRIAPRMANSVEVYFTVTENSAVTQGNFRTAIEVICPEFQNIPLNVRAYVGYPLFFPSWDFAFLKPCRLGEESTLVMPLVNDSHYALSVVAQGLEKPTNPATAAHTSHFSTSLSSESAEPSVIQPFSTVPVTFHFHGRQRGPFLHALSFLITKPFNITLPSALGGKTLHLVGICIEPYPHRPGEMPDKNGIDFVRMWMSHPKRIVDEYPTQEERARRFDIVPRAVDARAYAAGQEPEITYVKDPIIFRSSAAKATVGQIGDATMRRSQLQAVQIRNNSGRMQTAVLFGSTSFSVDPRSKPVQANDTESVDVIYLPQLDASDLIATYGFVIGLLDHDHTFCTAQVIAKQPFDFLVYPPPIREQTVVLDFGKIELSTHNLDINTKHLLLCNTYSTSYSWNIKFVSSKTKYTAFDAGMIMGELHPFETFAVPFRFHGDTSGAFESMAELYIKETLDRLAKPAKVITVILRGQTVSTSLAGIPDSIDFASTVVFETKRKSFVISNNGSTEAQVTLLARPPFYVMPKSFQLGPKGQQEVQVEYNPTESRTSSIRLLVFSNQKLYLVLLNGTGGTAELICEKYEKKDVDFGFQAEGTVGWLSVYLTNKGTLPLTLKAITAENPELLKIEFVAITSTVPYEGNQVTGERAGLGVSVRRDFWSILRRKFQVFSVLKQLVSHAGGARKAKSKGRRQLGSFQENGTLIRILPAILEVGGPGVLTVPPVIDPSLPHIVPQLRPFYSYHFRLGYVAKYQSKKDTPVSFHYMPITTEEDAASLNLLKHMSINVVGHVYRSLELFPPFHDFGLAPAEQYVALDARQRAHGRFGANNQYQMADTYGVVREGQSESEAVMQLEVLNMSMEAQNLTLQHIAPEFSIPGRTWHLQPGAKLAILVEFHPPKEQIQYHGEARFTHKYGTTTIKLAGTGASADLSCDEEVDFGSIKVGAEDFRTLRLHNRGLLDCRYFLEIIQQGTDFSLLDGADEPFEREGIIESGGLETVDIQCKCSQVVEKPPRIVIRWLRVPRGAWEEMVVPLLVQVGMPIFKMANMELDFRTTYINVNKTIEFTVTNDGNATCAWEAHPESELLTVEPDSGAVQPGETIWIEVTFSPQNIELLNSSISFLTDAGSKNLACYGIVGIPYLEIKTEHLDIDFGIVAINKTHSRAIEFTNTGQKPIEFEVTIMDILHDGVPMAVEDFDVFFVKPTNGVIDPMSTMNVEMQTMPREYNSVYIAEWMVRTRDGEQLRGRLSATGGKAIIKLAPPAISAQEAITKKPATAEMSVQTPPSRQRPPTAPTEMDAGTIESAKQAFAAHMENLQEVLAGLRAAEMDMAAERDAERALTPRPPTAGTPAGSRPGSARRRRDLTSAQAEEEEKRRQGMKVFDGSDLRARSRKARRSRPADMFDGLGPPADEKEVYERFDATRPSTRTSASARRRAVRSPLDVEDSAAVQYMDELSQLESELEVAIGLGESKPSTALSTPGSLGRSISSGLGRYQPGTPRSRKMSVRRDKSAAIRNMLSAYSEGLGASGDLLEGVGAESVSALAKPIEDIIGTAQEMLDDAKLVTDVDVQRTLLTAINERILESTRGVIKAVKEQLSNEWIGNREFLSSAIRRLQHSTNVMDAIRQAPFQKEQGENDFNLGLLRAGDKSNSILLFNLPNVGNLAFDFNLERKDTDRILPPGYDVAKSSDELFILDPTSGTIGPRESVNISATFQARATGTYQQTYDLISSGEVVLTFTVTAQVGSPNLMVNPKILEFGLVGRNKSDTRPIIVANVGTYADTFRIEALTADGGRAQDEMEEKPAEITPFVLDRHKGEVDPGGSVPLQVTFSPTQEGNFNQKYKIMWSKEPFLLEVKGTGGGWRIKGNFLEDRDTAFGGLDWGTCVVGCTYEKIFQLKNVGNIEGSVDLFHSNNSFRFEVPRDSEGLVRIAPGAAVDVKAIFWPSATETIKEGVQVRLPEQGLLLIPTRAVTGICEWSVEGKLELLNMPVLDIQNRQVKVTNTGSLDIPLELRVDPLEMAAEINIRALGWKEGDTVKPGQVVTVDITVSPTHPMLYDGKFTMTTNLGKGPVTHEYAFNFRAYKEQLALDDEKEASVGRIMYGETATVERHLTNFGNSQIKYRVRVEVSPKEGESEETLTGDVTAEKAPKKGKKGKAAKAEAAKEAKGEEKKKGWEDMITPWKLNIPTEGVLNGNETTSIKAVFESLEEDEGQWHEAKLIVEILQEGTTDKWTELSSVKLVGAGGRPKLEIEPADIDFKDAAVGTSMTKDITFRNDGTASLTYEILPDWDWSSCFTFHPSFPLRGKIDVEDSILVPLLFTPDQMTKFETEISIKTQLEVKKIRAKGQGAEYKILSSSLPEHVNFAQVLLGDLEVKKINILNDCIYPLTLLCDVLLTDPTLSDPSNPPEKADVFELTPDPLRLEENTKPDPTNGDRSNAPLTVKIKAPLPLGQDGTLDTDAVAALLAATTQRSFLRLRVMGGATHVVPVLYQWIVKHLVALVQGVTPTEGRILESDRLKTLDFGEGRMDEGVARSFVLHNPNNFKINFTANISDEHFTVSPTTGTISPKGFRELNCELQPLAVSEDEESDDIEAVPQSETYNANIEVMTNVESVGMLSVECVGTLVDEPLPLSFPEPVQFGPVRTGRAKEATLTFRNPVRRPLNWKVVVAPEFADVFRIQGPSEGTARPRAQTNITFTFHPSAPTDYSSAVFLETTEGNYTLSALGNGVKSAVTLNKTHTDFGVVGMGNPEFREIEVKNPTSLPIRLGARTTSEAFSTDVKELYLEPGETRSIRVYFNPTGVAERQKGQISFFNLDDMPEEEEQKEMEAIQQEFEQEEQREKEIMEAEGITTEEAPTEEAPIPSRPTSATTRPQPPPGAPTPGRVTSPLSRLTTASTSSRPITAVARISGTDTTVTIPNAPIRRGSPRTRPPTGREPRILTTIDLEGVGGEFGFTTTVADDTGGSEAVASISGDRPGTATAAITLNFPKVGEDSRVRKHFEVENCGDTVIELGVFDGRGDVVVEDVGGVSDRGGVQWKVSPARVEIRPRTRQRFTVVVKGQKAGDDTFSLSLRTLTLASQKTIPIQISTKTVSAMEALSASLRAFARADDSIEANLSYTTQEEIKYSGDIGIWKLLLPVIRLKPGLPSDEIRAEVRVPFVEPIVDKPDIAPFVVRPPAIPRDLPPRAKKWYMNRTSMALDQGGKARAGEDVPDLLRRQQAAKFVQPVEKRVNLERGVRRP
ncbi:hypothetical protein HDV00_006640 [Rhizophlyctis rosea]|nr:hypothetical protein HDV00_006640 [Rhizophlyctis rosea]